MILNLLSYNIRYGGVGRAEAIATVISACRPDLVVLQEATRPDIVQRIATLTEMPAWDARLGRSLGFLGRVPVPHHAWHRPAGSRHAFLELVLEGGEHRVFGVHLSAVHASWTERRRVRELRALLAAIAQYQRGFHVLTGDFNTVAPNETLDIARLPLRLRVLVWLSGGRIRWETIPLMAEAGYRDAFRALHGTADAGFTFPTGDPHVRLDYLFVPAGHATRVSRCQVVRDDAAREASDHFPLLSRIEV